MGKRIPRGKNQVLLGLLPGRTMDVKSAIVRIDRVSGAHRTDLSLSTVLTRVYEEARQWPPEHRPGFRDGMTSSSGDFVLIDPKHADAKLFPLVFWCQNRTCGAIVDKTNRSELPSSLCPQCRSGTLRQLRWVQYHRCGDLRPLKPPITCRACGGRRWRLDLRGSERLASFRWVCGNSKCRQATPLFAGRCPACAWPDPAEQQANIDVHRASRVYYTQTTTLLNVPSRSYEALLANPGRGALVASKFIGLPEAAGVRLADMAGSHAVPQPPAAPALDLEELFAGSPNVDEVRRRLEARQAQAPAIAAAPEWKALVEERTGVPIDVWDAAAPRILDALLPREEGDYRDTWGPAAMRPAGSPVTSIDIGLEKVSLLSDFPILTAAYGYTRADAQPGSARLNSFSPDADLGGKRPIFVDEIGADALVLTLDRQRVLRWLGANGWVAALPAGTDQIATEKGYFVELLTGAELRATVPASAPAVRMTFGLLHTLSHLAIRQAGVLSGLERTSLSEYLLPQALATAVFCSHRFGATIGALTALYEDALTQWLGMIRDASRCVYDPVCHEDAGSCHACSHLAETSCRFFNLNLSRAFLFGGPEARLGRVEVGYLDPALD